MDGPSIIAASIEANRIPDKFGNLWQYNPWSDHHSKVTSWAILFDLLNACPRLRDQIAAGKVAFGINHTMVDFQSDKEKALDLVLCIPRSTAPSMSRFSDLVQRYGLILSPAQQRRLSLLPQLPEREVSDVLVAVEAKACMTEHSKAGPRLYDELSSGWQCINGAAQRAVAVGFGMINAADEFISPKRIAWRITARKPAIITEHQQPKAAEKALATISRLRLRGDAQERGYDAIGVVMVEMRNDLGPVSLAPSPPAVDGSSSYFYEHFIRRITSIYDSRFPSL